MPVRDDGLYRGDGVFEVVRLYEGRPFALGEHLDRLERSAARIELPIDRARIEAEVAHLLVAHGAQDAELRIVVTRGGRRIAAIEELPPLAPSVALASVRYAPTVILTGAKTLSYGANMEATRLAVARGADEALLVRPDGVVSSRRLRPSSGRPATAACEHPPWARASSIRSPAARSSRRSATSRRGSTSSTSCSVRARPSSPPLCARCSR